MTGQFWLAYNAISVSTIWDTFGSFCTKTCIVGNLFTLSIGTPYLLSIFVLELDVVHILLSLDVSKILLYVCQTV